MNSSSKEKNESQQMISSMSKLSYEQLSVEHNIFKINLKGYAH